MFPEPSSKNRILIPGMRLRFSQKPSMLFTAARSSWSWTSPAHFRYVHSISGLISIITTFILFPYLPGLNKCRNHPSTLSHSSLPSFPIKSCMSTLLDEQRKTKPSLSCISKIKGYLFTFSELLIMSGYQKQGFKNIPYTFIQVQCGLAGLA